MVLEHREGCRFAVGSVHLDGNIPACERLRCVAAAAKTAGRALAGGGVDGGPGAVLAVGDFNFAASPEGPPQDERCLGGRACGMLREEYVKVRSLQEKRAVHRLPEALAALLQEGLASSEGRASLAALDGSPPFVDVPVPAAADERGVGRLELQPMPPGSFPTYPMCNVGNATYAELARRLLPAAAGDREAPAEGEPAAAQRGGAAAGGPASGAIALGPGLELDPGVIRDLYFRDAHKGHAGAIKKRGEVHRLSLGWLDRLYVGSQAPVRTLQGDPVFVLGEGDAPLDHALVPWLVAL